MTTKESIVPYGTGYKGAKSLIIRLHNQAEADTLDAICKGAAKANYGEYLVADVLSRGAVLNDRVATVIAASRCSQILQIVPKDLDHYIVRRFFFTPAKPKELVVDWKWALDQSGDATYRDMLIAMWMDAGVPIQLGKNPEAYAYGQKLAGLITELRRAEYE